MSDEKPWEDYAKAKKEADDRASKQAAEKANAVPALSKGRSFIMGLFGSDKTPEQAALGKDSGNAADDLYEKRKKINAIAASAGGQKPAQ